jgi:hypothetical protein
MSGDAFSRMMKMNQPEAQPASGDAFSRAMGNEQPAAPAAAQPASIDFTGPIEQVRAQIAQLPEDQREGALKQWAETYVANERKDGGIMQDAGDTVRNLARGTPVGSFLDEANAVTAAIPNALGMGGPNYAEAAAYQRATDKATEDDSTSFGELPLIGEVKGSGLTKLVGGVLSAPIAPMVRAVQGSTLLPQTANAVATGATYGGAYGAGEGTDMVSRAINTGIGTVAGGLFAAPIPTIMQGASAVGGAVNRLLQGGDTPNVQIDGRAAHPGAVRRVGRAINDDFADPTEFNQLSQRLDGEAMLADMGPNLQGQTGALASKPGAGSRAINTAVRNRKRGAYRRIEADLTRALGRPVNIPQMKEAVLRNANAEARPLYQQFENAQIEITPELRALIGRAEGLGAVREAARLMQVDGLDANAAQNTPVLLNYIKRAIDDTAYPPPGSNVSRSLRNSARDLVRELKNTVDSALSPENPQQSVWAQARRIAGTGQQFEEGLDLGMKAFSKKLSPDDMAYQMERLTPVGRQAFLIGSRAALRDDVIGASTQWGENAAAKARSLLGSIAAREKLGQLGPTEDIQRLTNRLDTESRYEGTYQNTLQNSKSEPRRQAAKEFPDAVGDGGNVDARWRDATMTGIVIETGARIANYLSQGALNERRLRIAEDAAQILIARGAAKDQLAQQFLQAAQQRGISQANAQALQKLAQRIVRASTPVVTDQATP